MSKLSQIEFVTLLDLMSRADLEQRLDAQEFIEMKPEGQNLVLKIAKKSTIAFKMKGGEELVPTISHDEKGEKKEKKSRRGGGKKSKPLSILAPKDCDFHEPIDFSIERFDKYLKGKGFKSAKTYSDGIKSMLKANGLQTLSGITILSLKTMRDSCATLDKTNMNRRTWLKKFNEYVIWEFEQQKEKAS